MYLHNDIIDLTKVLKKDVSSRCVTICNDQAAGDGVRDPRRDCSDRRDIFRQSGALDLGADRCLVPDDHTRFDDDADDGYAAGCCGADIVRGGADDQDVGEGLILWLRFVLF